MQDSTTTIGPATPGASDGRRPRAAVLGAMLAMLATSPGQTYVVSGYNEALCASEHAADAGLGVAPTELSAAYLVGTLLSAASLTHAGRVADRIGPRRMIALAGVGLALAGLGFSQVQGIVTLTLAFFALRFFGQGVMSLASSHALALRFDARLGSVEGLRGATVSLAIATAPLLAVFAIERAGWRGAAWMLPLGAGVLALVAAYGLMDADPTSPVDERGMSGAESSGERGHTLAEARRTRAFWILLGCTAFTAALLTAVHFHLQPLLQPRGMDETAAAATFVPYAVAGLVSTLVGGVLADRFEPARILGSGMVLVGLGAALLAATGAPWGAHVGMAVMATGHGLAMAVGAPTLARYFGRAHHGAIRGAAGTAAVAGSAGGPYALSAVAAAPLEGVFGGFAGALLLGSLAALPFAWFAFGLGRPVAR